MRKKNIKWKKSETIENENMAHSSWYTGKGMKTNMISGLLKQDYHMPRKQLKTTSQEFWIRTYKKGG